MRHDGRDCKAAPKQCGSRGCTPIYHHRLLHGIVLKKFFEMPIGTYKWQERKNDSTRASGDRAGSFSTSAYWNQPSGNQLSVDTIVDREQGQITQLEHNKKPILEHIKKPIKEVIYNQF